MRYRHWLLSSRFRQGAGEHYAKHWQNLVQHAKQANIQKLVMISSTSVYPDIAKAMNEQDASLALALDNSAFDAKARILLKAEQHVITSGMDYTILRCSGLIGLNATHHALSAKWHKSADSRQPICCICMTRLVSLIFH